METNRAFNFLLQVEKYLKISLTSWEGYRQGLQYLLQEEKVLQNFYKPHCPKKSLIWICIKPEPVADGADATAFVGHKNQTNTGLIRALSVTGSVLIWRFSLCFGTVLTLSTRNVKDIYLGHPSHSALSSVICVWDLRDFGKKCNMKSLKWYRMKVKVLHNFRRKYI